MCDSLPSVTLHLMLWSQTHVSQISTQRSARVQGPTYLLTSHGQQTVLDARPSRTMRLTDPASFVIQTVAIHVLADKVVFQCLEDIEASQGGRHQMMVFPGSLTPACFLHRRVC